MSSKPVRSYVVLQRPSKKLNAQTGYASLLLPASDGGGSTVRVIFVWHRFPNPEVGDTTRCYHFMRELSQRHGQEIGLIAATCAPEDRKHLDEVSRFAEVLFPGIPLSHPNQFELLSRSLWNSLSPRSLRSPLGMMNYYADPKLPTRIRSLVAGFQHDVAYVNGTMAYLLPQLKQPRICDPHDVLSIALRQQIATTRTGIRKLALIVQYLRTDLTERMAFPHADKLIVVTQKERARLESRTGLLAEVVPNGVDTSFFSPQSSAKRGYDRVLFFGDLAAPENVQAILHLFDHVFPEIKKRYNNIEVDIVGRNPSPQVADASIRFGAHLYPNVPDIRYYIANSLVCVLPSYQGTGIKNKVLEAMAMGATVISTEIGAEGIASGPEEGLIVARDDGEMLRFLERALTDRQGADEVGRRARRTVMERFDWSIPGETLHTIIENLARCGA